MCLTIGDEAADPSRNLSAASAVERISAHETLMQNPWLALTWKAAHLCIEAQSVMALRMLRLATGGARAEAEVQRMIAEKALAAAQAQTAAATALVTGRKPHVAANKALRVYKKRVSANKRRLARR